MLAMFREYIPSEFGRKCRSFQEIERWKATEYPQFFLYSSIVVLKNNLSLSIYNHFLLLYVEIFSL